MPRRPALKPVSQAPRLVKVPQKRGEPKSPPAFEVESYAYNWRSRENLKRGNSNNDGNAS